MPEPNAQLLERLRQLQISAPDIEAAAIVSMDGLIIASALPQDVEPDRVAAMSASLLSLGERISWELQRGALDQMFIKGEQGYIGLIAISGEAVLTVLARKEAKLGMVLLVMRRAAEELATLL